jgi:hypothetical protein
MQIQHTLPNFYPDRTAADYSTVIMTPHRNAPPRIRPPGLVAHVCFWNPLSPPPIDLDNKNEVLTNNDYFKDKRKARSNNIDTYLSKIFSSICVRDIDKRRSSNIVDDTICLYEHYLDKSGALHSYDVNHQYKPPGNNIIIVFSWRQALATIKVEQHTEYVAITYFIDLSPGPEEGPRQSLANTSDDDQFKQLITALDNLNESIQSNADSDGSIEKAAFWNSFFAIWNAFYKDILDVGKDEEKGLGDIFKDSRGLILGSWLGPPGIFRPKTHNSGNCRWNPFRNKRKYWFQEPFQRVADKATLDSDEYHGSHNSIRKPIHRTPTDVLTHFWRFFTVDVQNVSLLDHEMVACRLLGDRAIYVSGLGPQPKDPNIYPKRQPIIFFLYCNTLNGWQIGRLIAQINELGTARLAAMKYFDGLKTAGYIMQTISRDIEVVRLNFENTKRSEPEFIKDYQNPFASAVADLDRRIAMMQKPFQGNINYRMQRSLYYIRHFRTGIKSLRIGRIEGFQPYDQFVERRLGPAFNLIELLIAQFDGLKRARTALFQYYLTSETISLGDTTTKANIDVRYLQTVADTALWFALIPYYTGTIVFERMLNLSDGAVRTAAMWITLWAATASAGIATRHERIRRPTGAICGIPTRIALVFVIASLAIAMEVLEWRYIPHDESRSSTAGQHHSSNPSASPVQQGVRPRLLQNTSKPPDTQRQTQVHRSSRPAPPPNAR